MNMNAVGIDVSKRKSTVAILRPGGKAVGKPCPAVKSIAGDFYGICLIGLDFAERIVLSLEVTDDLGIHSAYKKARLGKFTCHRFIVAASTFHDNASFTIKLPDPLYQRLEICEQMRNIKGLSNSLPTRTEDCYRAFSFERFFKKFFLPCSTRKNLLLQ